MKINYYGAFCFKVQSGDKVLAFDPPAKESSFKAPRFQADIVFVGGSDDKDRSGFENITSKDEEQPFLVNGPGEYEIGGIAIRGIKDTVSNAIYVLNFEDIKVCHLGRFNQKELNSEKRESIGEVDVLFVPVETETDIKKIIGQLEPKVVIPMNYDKKTLEKFLKETGGENNPVDKFSFKKKDIAEKKSEIVILKA